MSEQSTTTPEMFTLGGLSTMAAQFCDQIEAHSEFACKTVMVMPDKEGRICLGFSLETRRTVAGESKKAATVVVVAASELREEMSRKAAWAIKEAIGAVDALVNEAA